MLTPCSLLVVLGNDRPKDLAELRRRMQEKRPNTEASAQVVQEKAEAARKAA